MRVGLLVVTACFLVLGVVYCLRFWPSDVHEPSNGGIIVVPDAPQPAKAVPPPKTFSMEVKDYLNQRQHELSKDLSSSIILIPDGNDRVAHIELVLMRAPMESWTAESCPFPSESYTLPQVRQFIDQAATWVAQDLGKRRPIKESRSLHRFITLSSEKCEPPSKQELSKAQKQLVPLLQARMVGH